jgi:hypothetical protein
MRYFASADLAFASDSSALVIVGFEAGGYVVVLVEELRPKRGAPLRPRHVIDTFAGHLRAFGVTSMTSDAHYRESAREHLEPHGIQFVDAPGGHEGKERVYLHAKKLIHESRVRIPRHPRMLAQLRAVVSKPVPGGGVTISSPRRAGGGHGDLVSALTLALWTGRQAEKKPKPRAHLKLDIVGDPDARLGMAGMDAAFERQSIDGGGQRMSGEDAFRRHGWMNPRTGVPTTNPVEQLESSGWLGQRVK